MLGKKSNMASAKDLEQFGPGHTLHTVTHTLAHTFNADAHLFLPTSRCNYAVVWVFTPCWEP